MLIDILLVVGGVVIGALLTRLHIKWPLPFVPEDHAAGSNRYQQYKQSKS